MKRFHSAGGTQFFLLQRNIIPLPTRCHRLTATQSGRLKAAGSQSCSSTDDTIAVSRAEWILRC